MDVISDGTRKEFWADSWDVHIQDGGRTVKLFAKGDGEQPRVERAQALAADMVEDLRKITDRYGG